MLTVLVPQVLDGQQQPVQLRALVAANSARSCAVLDACCDVPQRTISTAQCFPQYSCLCAPSSQFQVVCRQCKPSCSPLHLSLHPSGGQGDSCSPACYRASSLEEITPETLLSLSQSTTSSTEESLISDNKGMQREEKKAGEGMDRRGGERGEDGRLEPLLLRRSAAG
jgi:hypothetical protein